MCSSDWMLHTWPICGILLKTPPIIATAFLHEARRTYHRSQRNETYQAILKRFYISPSETNQ